MLLNPDVLNEDLPRRSFASLMDLYESNYELSRQFLGKFLDSGATEWTSADRELPLQLKVLERAKYTTTLHLTYVFTGPDGEVADPDLEIRIYSDAKQAEAYYCGRNERCVFLREFRIDIGSSLERKWQLNKLLHKWLIYLLRQQKI